MLKLPDYAATNNSGGSFAVSNGVGNWTGSAEIIPTIVGWAGSAAAGIAPSTAGSMLRIASAGIEQVGPPTPTAGCSTGRSAGGVAGARSPTTAGASVLGSGVSTLSTSTSP